MALAYKFADYATQRTQPMFSPEHRSSLSRGNPVEKLITFFSAFTSRALSLMRRHWRDAKGSGDPKKHAKLLKVLFFLLVFQPLGRHFIYYLRDRIYGRKPKHIGWGILDSWASYFYIVRDIEYSLSTKLRMGTFRGYDLGNPVLTAGNSLINSIAYGFEALTEKSPSKQKDYMWKFIDESASFILMMMGLPYKTPKKYIVGEGRKGSTGDAASIWEGGGTNKKSLDDIWDNW